VKKIYSRIQACGYALGEPTGTFGNGWIRTKDVEIEFPRTPMLPQNISREKFKVRVSEEDIRFWRDVAATLTRDPNADIVVKP
jgi:hypothetical protein